MLFVLLFLAAFIYFIVERKIKCSFIPGIVVTLIPCFLIVWDFVNNSLLRGRYYRVIRNLGLGRVRVSAILLISTGIAILAPVCIVVFFFLGKLVGKALFTAEKDGKGYNRIAKILYITASALVGISGIIWIPYNSFRPSRYGVELYKKLLAFMKFYGVSRFPRGIPVLFGSILIFISITCIVLICTKIPFYKNLKSKTPAGETGTAQFSGKNLFSLIGIILSAIGHLGTWITALVGIVSWKRIYFYNGYEYTKVLCTLFLILMLVGIVFLIIGMAKLPAQKNGAKRVVFLILSIILLAASVIDSIWLILNAMRYVFKL